MSRTERAYLTHRERSNQKRGDCIFLSISASIPFNPSHTHRNEQYRLLLKSAGIVGPVSRFFNDTSAPEHKDTETLGRAMFENESFEEWSNVYKSNTFSIYFVTMAFLGLLAKGSEDSKEYTSCVVNITSISGVIKVAQCHVSSPACSIHLFISSFSLHIHLSCINQLD